MVIDRKTLAIMVKFIITAGPPSNEGHVNHAHMFDCSVTLVLYYRLCIVLLVGWHGMTKLR